jgi:hypothetical protein
MPFPARPAIGQDPWFATREVYDEAIEAAIEAAEAEIDAAQEASGSKADQAALDAHTGDGANPHSVTKDQVGLSNVDNTSDAGKPVSTATQTALNLKADQSDMDTAEAAIADHTTAIARVESRVFDVRSYGATGDGTTDDTVSLQAAIDAAAVSGGDVFVPAGEYRLTTWLLMRSNVRLYGVGTASILANDKTNATVDKQACILPGLHHPALMATQTGYTLNAITAHDPSVTCTTAGDAANFDVGDLVIVGSDTDISGVSRHAQLNKITAISSGTVTLQDPIVESISDGKIWTITGTDPSTSTPVYAVENVVVEDLGFKGRTGIATKGAVYKGIFRNLHMLDVHHFIGTNMLTHVLIENMYGQYSGRYLEFAFNSYDVTARNWKGTFRTPSALQTGETQVFPIHIGEQSHTIILDDVFCHVDAGFTQATEIAQVKGSNLLLRKVDLRHGGTAGSYVISITDCNYTGFRHDDITFENCLIDCGTKVRTATIGEGTVNAQNPVNVRFLGGELRGTPSGESLWFQAGTGFACSMTDKTGKAVKVSNMARYPNLSGYRRVV